MLNIKKYICIYFIIIPSCLQFLSIPSSICCTLLPESSNINEVIRAALKFLFYFIFFFTKNILHTQKTPKTPKAPKAPKSTKSTKKNINAIKQKHKMQISEQKWKMHLKTSEWEKKLIRLFVFFVLFVCAKKRN